jgi:hypothetical protein
MASPAPLGVTLTESDTLTPIMPQAPASGSTEERLARLEQSVSAIQSDYQRIMPAFASLNTTNERIQTLLGEIEKEKGLHTAAALNKTAAPALAPAPAAIKTVTTTETPSGTVEVVEEETVPATGVIPPAGSVSRAEPVKTVTDAKTTVTTTSVVANESAPPLSSIQSQPTAEEARAEAARQTQTAAPAPAAAGHGNSVTGVRIGEHGSKTRLVFDLQGKTKPAFKYDLDNAEKLLLVDMAATGWTGGTAGRPKSPLIDSWTVTESMTGGSSVAIQLKKSARVISTQFLGAEGKDPARLVVDIAPQG